MHNKNDYPTTNGSYDRTFGGSEEVFISKFNLNLSTLLLLTFVGGNNIDNAYGIDIDNEGNIYITGYTGGDFPVSENAYDTIRNGYMDAFVTKLNSTLSSIIYSTYIGGNENDVAYDIIVTEKGMCNNHWCRQKSIIPYPTTKGAYDRD
ncbi:MAG: SBBP repeat-containing protein [Candidatus Moduliflexus flocculans]|nr:SBBP repeat-containing protein [Candidatus Moduliflexus flocculans]